MVLIAAIAWDLAVTRKQLIGRILALFFIAKT
jgi:hypothetical protein